MPEIKGIELRLVLVLVVIMIGSGLFLTSIYQLTIPFIRSHEAAAREKAIFAVLPEATEYETLQKNDLELYRGLDETGVTVGYAMEHEGAGFQDLITLMIGFDLKSEEVSGIEVLNMAETPGLGARIDEAEFKDQFAGKSFADPFAAGEDIDSISGATLSTESVAEIVLEAIEKVTALEVGGEE